MILAFLQKSHMGTGSLNARSVLTVPRAFISSNRNDRKDKNKTLKLSQLLAITQSNLLSNSPSNVDSLRSPNRADIGIAKLLKLVDSQRQPQVQPPRKKKSPNELANQKAFYHHPSTGSGAGNRSGLPLLPPPAKPPHFNANFFPPTAEPLKRSVPTPKQIRSFLDRHVIGQDDMKRRLSIALYNHYIRLENNTANADSLFTASETEFADHFPQKPRLELINKFASVDTSGKKPATKFDLKATPVDFLFDQTTAALLPRLVQKKPHDIPLNQIDAAKRPQPDNAHISIEDPIQVEKSNVLLIGPSGSGKTMVIKTIAKLLDVPFSMNDATPLTQAGYIGEDVEICIYRLLQNADFDVTRAERGIVFLDEVDKIASRSSSVSNSSVRDASGEGVQQGLLRMLEGTSINFNVKVGNLPVHLRPHGASPAATEPFTVDTSNILFVCAGAFVGLDKIVKERNEVKGSIGFGAKLSDDKKPQQVAAHANESADLKWLPHVEPDDLIRFGLIPEFIGRLPIVVTAKPLAVEELARILTEPKNSLIQQFQRLFHRFNVELAFTELSIDAIAHLALTKKTGARGLRRILENLLVDVQYELPGSDHRYALVTKETVENKQPVHVYKVGEVDIFQQALSQESRQNGSVESLSQVFNAKIN